MVKNIVILDQSGLKNFSKKICYSIFKHQSAKVIFNFSEILSKKINLLKNTLKILTMGQYLKKLARIFFLTISEKLLVIGN